MEKLVHTTLACMTERVTSLLYYRKIKGCSEKDKEHGTLRGLTSGIICIFSYQKMTIDKIRKKR
jgi:hypothetical protein